MNNQQPYMGIEAYFPSFQIEGMEKVKFVEMLSPSAKSVTIAHDADGYLMKSPFGVMKATAEAVGTALAEVGVHMDVNNHIVEILPLAKCRWITVWREEKHTAIVTYNWG
ncbi:hypothetical protein [Sulfuriroseicoccus oceanibius]|uniref:Uncharacterized protein n=1 Tax=Sulfuriroseicoccus oceanibius TaxID=2707525 RepID=A0A6B3LCU9_9BACT|nr:hypothetical protein [Sulfuriroseicoccus oceanibius]QQL44838.1 hypothetical protein G3M56_013315 [Sulfuriroseicoccus oceanibius]